MRSFLRHALLDDTHDGARFADVLHARLVRIACASGPLAAPVAALLAGCVAWSRPNLGVEGGGGFALRLADVADALEAAEFAATTDTDACDVAGAAAAAASRGRAFTISTTR